MGEISTDISVTKPAKAALEFNVSPEELFRLFNRTSSALPPVADVERTQAADLYLHNKFARQATRKDIEWNYQLSLRVEQQGWIRSAENSAYRIRLKTIFLDALSSHQEMERSDIALYSQTIYPRYFIANSSADNTVIYWNAALKFGTNVSTETAAAFGRALRKTLVDIAVSQQAADIDITHSRDGECSRLEIKVPSYYMFKTEYTLPIYYMFTHLDGNTEVLKQNLDTELALKNPGCG